MNKRSAFISSFFFLWFSVFPVPILADLSMQAVDPLAGIENHGIAMDSVALIRMNLAKELDTHAPKMDMPYEDAWWNQFDDPTLTWLIDAATRNNYNLASAIHSIEASRYALQGIKSGYYPTLSASAMYQAAQESGATMKGAPTSPVKENFMGLSLDLSWEVDIFGRVRKQTEAGKATYNASRAEYVATLTSLCSQVASVYFDLAAARQLYATALSHLESQEKIYNITKVRMEAGLSSKLDVSQAYTVVLDTRSSLPTYLSEIENDIDMLVLLTNLDRNEIESRTANIVLPNCEADMVNAIPIDLIRRRPDVAEAEYSLAEACAKAGLAQKDWLPTLSLSASVGTESHAAKNLFTGKSFNYSVTPTLAWTVFDGFQRKYSIAEAKEQVLMAADSYDYTVANARYEVSTSRNGFLYQLQTTDLLQQAANNSQESLQLSLELYKSGLDPFTDVMNAQISWLSYELSVISNKYNALSSLTTLYRALGGGWNGVLPTPSEVNHK